MVLPLVPEAVHTGAGLALKVTGCPEAPPAALTVNGGEPMILVGRAPNVIVWLDFGISSQLGVALECR